MPIKCVVLTLCFVLTASMVTAASETLDRNTLYTDGLAAFDRGEYGQAAELFTRLTDEGVSNGPLYYNIGVCRLHEGRIGLARVWFDRAAYYMPSDPDLRQNAAYAASHVGKTGDAMPQSTLAALLVLPRILPAPVVYAMAAVLVMLCWIILMVRRLRPNMAPPALGAASGVIACFAAVCVLCAAVLIWQTVWIRQAYVVTEKAEVRSGNTSSATLLAELPDGSAIQLVENMGEYVRVRFGDDRTGWIETTSVVAR
ncbi:tetratricopeptide repeat protein [Desulfovibrio inopinatus]|uniref:tetratricopeptide repeat protein n=1 Tax=Desulfovibrio inopinatus TaxID=102109 RepID=UPI000480C812|nr:tetratricopeptide repeat protein [Desulfovibrio inopinatus]